MRGRFTAGVPVCRWALVDARKKFDGIWLNKRGMNSFPFG